MEADETRFAVYVLIVFVSLFFSFVFATLFSRIIKANRKSHQVKEKQASPNIQSAKALRSEFVLAQDRLLQGNEDRSRLKDVCATTAQRPDELGLFAKDCYSFLKTNPDKDQLLMNLMNWISRLRTMD